ncbi:hypothetical protein GCM10023107_33320 [Actinoplanes octamycinicus]|nr:hypothetical protein Aoc01nite_47060 [Actinoplanes octamycinicus]
MERAERTASETRAAPTADDPPGPDDAAAGPPAGAVRCLAAPAGVAAGALPAGRVTAPLTVPGAAAGRAEAVPGAAPLPFVTIGTAAEALATAGPPGRLPSASDPVADGSPGGGAMPGALVNFGGDGASAGTAARPAASRPFDAAPSFFAASSGVAEVPWPPDFACVSGIN